MSTMQDEGCPTCGSQSATRLAGPDDRSSDVEDLDMCRSGTFACERCGTEYYAEVSTEPQLKKIGENLPKFSPTARCTKCQSYRTSVRTTQSEKNRRSHQCEACYAIFWTEMTDK